MSGAGIEETTEMKFALYCKCGGAWRGNMPDDAAAYFREAWAATHNAPGCGPCDAATASRARTKAEREEFERGH